MGKIVIEKWQCDRCGKVEDKRPYSTNFTRYELRVVVDYGTAGGIEIDWKEMCDQCNRDVAKELEALKQPSASRRQALKDSSHE